VVCWVASGQPLAEVNKILDLALSPGDHYQFGGLQIISMPFLSQHEYDQLLWACDINFVRGEDSFIRAHWAGKPFVWQIYPQEDLVHLQKLDAFIAKYSATASPELSLTLATLWHHWNAGENCQEAWQSLVRQQANWIEHSQNWCDHLRVKPDLAANLVQFCQKAL
jgi:uncharacterized repeat protein (TIGR03837 family)